jgi:hypothetical protein
LNNVKNIFQPDGNTQNPPPLSTLPAVHASQVKGGVEPSPSGVYFYKLEMELAQALFLPAIDLGQGKQETFPIVKEGFVQLVR